MYFVPSIALKGIETLIESYGVDPSALMLEVGFSPELLSRPDNLIEGQQIITLIEHCARTLNQRFFGLQLAKIQGSIVLGPLWFLLRNAATVGDAVHRLLHNYPSHTEASYFAVEKNRNGIILTYEVNPSLTGSVTQVIELGLGIACMHLRDYLGLHWTPTAAYLRVGAPYEKRPLTEIFGSNIYFDQEFNGIVLSNEEMQSSIKDASRLQREHYEHEVLKHQDFHPRSAVVQTENIINASLTRFPCSLEFVARCLDQKPRTLQHYLKQQGTSYQQIFQKVRLNLALRYLSQSKLSITQISERLQFSETAVFTRFMKKHTGLTPKQHRR